MQDELDFDRMLLDISTKNIMASLLESLSQIKSYVRYLI